MNPGGQGPGPIGGRATPQISFAVNSTAASGRAGKTAAAASGKTIGH